MNLSLKGWVLAGEDVTKKFCFFPTITYAPLLTPGGGLVVLWLTTWGIWKRFLFYHAEAATSSITILESGIVLHGFISVVLYKLSWAGQAAAEAVAAAAAWVLPRLGVCVCELWSIYWTSFPRSLFQTSCVNLLKTYTFIHMFTVYIYTPSISIITVLYILASQLLYIQYKK